MGWKCGSPGEAGKPWVRGCGQRAVADKQPAMLPYSPAIVAESLLAHLDAAAAARGRASLAIPGGRSPGAALSELARICPPFVRERLDLLWLDERAVPDGHADRNDLPTLQAWRSGGALPARVHVMPADAADLQQAAETYAGTLRAATVDGRVDVCLVGLGEDGHLASLFPRHAGLAELSDCFAVVDSPKPPARRLTLSLPVLCRARARQVLCLGAAKAWTLKAWMTGPDAACPASLLPRQGTDWFLDDAAVQALGEL